MKKYIAVLLTYLAFTGPVFGGLGMSDEEKKVKEFIPELKALDDRCPNDVEIQLGLAALHIDGYFDSNIPPEEEYYKKILTIDPNNKIACAHLSAKTGSLYLSERRWLFDRLEGKKRYAQERGFNELKIESTIGIYSPRRKEAILAATEREKRRDLYYWFKEDNNDIVIIRDFNDAAQELRERLDDEVPEVIAEIDGYQSKDPDNAKYNYLKAYIYFQVGQKHEGLKEVEKAVTKKYWNNYEKEVTKARVRVLRDVNFPQPYRRTLESTNVMHGSFLCSDIWQKELEPLAKNYEEKGDFQNAMRIYSLSAGITKHVKEEPLPYESEYNERCSKKINDIARQRIEELTKKKLEKQSK